MEWAVTAEQALAIDKLLRYPKSETMSFSSTSFLTIQLISPNFNQLVQVKLDAGSFQHYRAACLFVTIPYQKFHMANMKSLKVQQTAELTLLEYEFDGYAYTKRICNTPNDDFCMDFSSSKQISVDFNCLHEVLKGVKAKKVNIEILRNIKISYSGNTIEIDGNAGLDSLVGMSVETEPLKNLIAVAGTFYEGKLLLAKDRTCINIIFRNSTTLLSIFLAVDYT